MNVVSVFIGTANVKDRNETISIDRNRINPLTSVSLGCSLYKTDMCRPNPGDEIGGQPPFRFILSLMYRSGVSFFYSGLFL